MDDISFSESPPLSDDELNALFDASWPARRRMAFQPVLARSVVYIAARQGEKLVGFVNVATDGGVHAFLVDPTVLPEFRNRGIGTSLVRRAIAAAGERRMEWVHVDFDEKDDLFYRRAGFQPTLAGVVRFDRRDPVVSVGAAAPPVSSPFERLAARGLLAQCFLGAIVVMVVAMLIPGFVDMQKPNPSSLALFYLGVGIVLYLRARNAGVSAERLFGPAPSLDTLRLTIVAVPLGMLAIAGFFLLFLPLSFLAPDAVRRWALENPAPHQMQTLATWAGQFVVAVAIAPVIEEVMFRGMLMHRWALRWGTATGVVLSSALFAFLHVEVLGHFVFGVVMCVLYLRTRSLWVPIATHALNNALASLMGLSSVLKPQQAEKDMTLASLRSNWWAGFVLLALALLLLETYRRRFWSGVDLRALLRGRVPYEA